MSFLGCRVTSFLAMTMYRDRFPFPSLRAKRGNPGNLTSQKPVANQPKFELRSFLVERERSLRMSFLGCRVTSFLAMTMYRDRFPCPSLRAKRGNPENFASQKNLAIQPKFEPRSFLVERERAIRMRFLGCRVTSFLAMTSWEVRSPFPSLRAKRGNPENFASQKTVAIRPTSKPRSFY
jgi:hypothetical protein